MPIKTAQFTLGSAVRTLIAPNDAMSQTVCIHNHEHSQSSTIYVGGADVTIENGIHTRAGETSHLTLGPSDTLYAISDTGGVEIHVLRVTQD